MNSHETPVVIACQGDPLIGVIHLPEQPLQRGLLMIVAGGPQYRGGCCRQLVYASRRLAAAGIPVLRFDYRGMGDSAGPFRGFNHVENDLQAALRVFREYAPQVQEFILWGGCDAASASMINGWRLPGVAGLILGNPFVHSEETGDRVTVKHHYWRRIREKSFWMKVLRGQFNPFPALLTVIRVMLPQRFKSPTTGPSNSFETLPFQHKMREGIQHFPGHVLLLMSGKSLVSKEFDELLNTDDAWRTAMAGPASVTRHDLPDADQAFSTIDARNEMIAIAEQWLRAWPKPG